MPLAEALLHSSKSPLKCTEGAPSSMLGFHFTHSVLVRSLTELGARDPSLIDTSLPIDSIPIVGSLASPLVGEANGGKQPSTSPGNLPSSSSPAGNPPLHVVSAIDIEINYTKGGGNNPTSSPTPTSSGNSAFRSGVLSNTTPTPNPGNPSSSSSAQNGNAGSSTASSSGTGGSEFPLVSSGNAASALAMASTPSGSLPTSAGSLATNFLDTSQSLLGTGSNTAGALAPSSTTAEATSAGERLSGGTIAGITIVCLVTLLALSLLVFRCRSIARRVELRNQWWFNRDHGARSFSRSGRSRGPMNANEEVSTSRLSARSSFATTFDQGLMFRVESLSRFSGVAPEYPPMAEVRGRNSVLISTGGTVARRTSLNSMLTNGSDPDSQYLAVSTGQNNLEPFAPMFVRPFSPSESFFFPKPPMRSLVDSFFLGTRGHTSSVSSATTLVQVSPPHPALLINHPSPSTAFSQSLTTTAALSPLAAAAHTSPDPFADPVKSEFADIDIIRRPFAPSLDDELMVYPDDQVRIFQVFDDDWAFVEKLADTEGKQHERGLIPLDCLREADRPLPTSLAPKRIGYGSDQPIGCVR